MIPYSIVYSSRTGNTALLAETLRELLPREDCVYFGAAEEKGADKALEAERIYVGFWTDKGCCDEELAAFLERMRGKQIFLFGTAGFGRSGEYFDQILGRVRGHLDPSNEVIGSYMCQGKMPPAVRQRYEAMGPQDPEKMGRLIENFDLALAHPDAADLEGLKKAVNKG